jgi:hypothetical protein
MNLGLSSSGNGVIPTPAAASLEHRRLNKIIAYAKGHAWCPGQAEGQSINCCAELFEELNSEGGVYENDF